MEPKRPRRRPAPRSGRSIWRTLNSRPDGCAPTSASFTIPAIPNPGSLPCPNGRATCAPWTTARGGASSQCSRTSNRAVSALRTPRSASLTAWIASSWSWPSPSTGRSPQASGMPSTMPLPAKKKRSRSTQESGPQPNLLVHQGPPPHRQDRPILPAAPAPLGGAAKLMDGKGRPASVIDPKQLEALAGLWLTKEAAADFLGVSRATLFTKLKDDPEIEAAWLRGRAKLQATTMQGLINSARQGSVRALTFLAERVGSSHRLVGNGHARWLMRV